MLPAFSLAVAAELTLLVSECSGGGYPCKTGVLWFWKSIDRTCFGRVGVSAS